MADKMFVFIVSEETGAAWRQNGLIKLSIETCTTNGKICTNVKTDNERVSSVWPGLSRFKGKNNSPMTYMFIYLSFTDLIAAKTNKKLMLDFMLFYRKTTGYVSIV